MLARGTLGGTCCHVIHHSWQLSYITADSMPRDLEPVAEAELSRVTCSAIIQNNLTLLQIRDKLHKYGIGSSAWWPSSYQKQPSNRTKCMKLHLFVNSENLWLSKGSQQSESCCLPGFLLNAPADAAVMGSPSRAYASTSRPLLTTRAFEIILCQKKKEREKASP